MLTVAAVARRLGVAPATLRTWDRRYGLGPSEHTAGSHRRYSATDVGRLMVMRRLTLEGVPPAEAAGIARTSEVPDDLGLASVTAIAGRPVPVGGPSASTSPPVGEDVWPVSRAAVAAPRRAPGDDHPTGAGAARPDGGDRSGASSDPHGLSGLLRDLDEPAGGPLDDTVLLDGLDELDELDGSDAPLGRAAGSSTAPRGRAPLGDGPAVAQVVSLPDGSPAVRGLTRAAATLDSHECVRLVRQHIERHGTVRTWEHLVAPVLVALGRRWHDTGAGIEVEHVLTESVLQCLRGVAAGLRHPRNSRPVLLAAAEEEQHGLPLHVLTAALAERGVACRLLGVRVPRAALAAAVRRSGPAVVLVYAQLRVRDPEQLRELPRLRPSPLLLLGGPGWAGADTPPGAEHVADLEGAAERIVTAVGA